MSETHALKTSGHIDWLAITFDGKHSLYDLLPNEKLDYTIQHKGNGAHGYRSLHTSDIGVIYMTDGSDKQGIHMVCTGTALEQMREAGLSDREVLAHLLDISQRLTRLDVAIDVINGEMTAEDLAHDYRDGTVKTLARAGTLLKDLDGPADTLYIGSRSSERFFRAYNKGAQMGTDYPWLRLELETKKLVARALAQTLAKFPRERQVINSAMRKFIDFPRQMEYQTVLRGSNVPIPPTPRKDTNTLTWLLETVAPSLAKFEMEHPDLPVEDMFIKAWENARNKLSG